MIERLRRWIGTFGIRAQIVMLLVGTQLLAHAVTFGFMLYLSSELGRKSEVIRDLSDPMFSVLRVLGDDPAKLDVLVDQDRRFSLVDEAPRVSSLPEVDAVVTEAIGSGPVADVVAFALPASANWPPAPRVQPFGLASRAPDGRWLIFTPRPNVITRTLPRVASTLALSLLALPLMLMSVWAGAWLVAPIARLSAATNAFARDIQAPDMAVEGALEVRRAIVAFNHMQHKLRRLIDDRANTLASIGHDMRTPLTRLRLRLETTHLGDAKAPVERDLSVLETMIDDALRFMRDDQHQVDLQNIDLTALCQTAVDAMRDQGHDVVMSSTSRVVAIGDLTLTMRALDNILNNAVKHADAAVVAVEINLDSATAQITVTDTGPGIPDHLIAFVQQPFNRLPTVAAGDTGDKSGFGLGLAIASDLMARQSGTLELAANTPHGLRATLTLPTQRDGA
ncbi:HAMP domain-containing sensor histidine kinase [uncultured Tateyamaria sp.]|uniref:HAMP domain-containing sensor histidine kinase n=1 Tax=uncultured Tateyamaria sp. TaxID=455651 RepID=UPI00260D54CD|nr:HAMP domain-containing sensor histidine kinase [uncultured Tateyamaria sp.]